MRFVTFKWKATRRPGMLLDDGRVLDLRLALPIACSAGVMPPWQSPRLCEDLVDFIELADELPALVERLEKASATVQFKSAVVEASDFALVAPIPKPRKNVFCVGRNYIDHVAEGDRTRNASPQIPKVPQFFTKPSTSVLASGMDVEWDPRVTAELDYEVELAIIIGKQGRDISEKRALDHVFGYTIINDISARDLQRAHGQWFKGKALDSSCPMGPWIVHREALKQVNDIAISLRVNGELRQQARTSQLIFGLPRIIRELSSGMTLHPGDIIATGTPAGVGFAMEPPQFLEDGDVVTCEIEGIGTLVNRIARRVSPTA
jgi:2-keto-4-pentenoate hydratase/2-oxohepta-3-ene-1,7-dioic acid hydratase in catechol pathway